MRYRTTISLRPHRHADLIAVLERLDEAERTSYLCDLAAETVRVWKERSAFYPTKAEFPLGSFLPPATPSSASLKPTPDTASSGTPADTIPVNSVPTIPVMSPEKAKAAFGRTNRNSPT